MIYTIERASCRNYRDFPCEEAIKREFINYKLEVESEWSVEINTLEQLHQFIDKHGSIVITDSADNYINPHIIIYDSYIE